MSPILQICCLLPQAAHHDQVLKFLGTDRFKVTSFSSVELLSKNLIEQQSNQDCLVIWIDEEIPNNLLADLLGICLPTVIISQLATTSISASPAAVNLEAELLIELPEAIEKAIALFLRLPSKMPTSEQDLRQKFDRLAQAQHRLSQKLQERLGYLGVYYKRDPTQFWRRLNDEEKSLYIQRLQEIYRSVILEYFKEKSKTLNTLIDEFASACFFADISVSQVLNIHMELMEDFAKQLRLEGRNEEILLDYRITLIDAVAHLCEMYRRSIPKDSQK